MHKSLAGPAASLRGYYSGETGIPFLSGAETSDLLLQPFIA